MREREVRERERESKVYYELLYAFFVNSVI